MENRDEQFTIEFRPSEQQRKRSVLSWRYFKGTSLFLFSYGGRRLEPERLLFIHMIQDPSINMLMLRF